MPTDNSTEQKSPPVFFAASLGLEQHHVALNSDEAAHAIKVRRMRIGDPIHVTNGEGLLGKGVIVSLIPKPASVSVEIRAISTQPPPQITLTLASAIPKGERQSTLLDMAVQLGVNVILPLDCEHSVVRFQNKMRGRWARVIRSACKQSRQLHLPRIKPQKTVEAVLEGVTDKTLIVFGDMFGESIYQVAEGIISPVDHILLLVGPEGGFSESEQSNLSAVPHAHALSAGEQILRTETAAIALTTLAAQLRQHLS